jgi:predicted phage baseplate assembly protein
VSGGLPIIDGKLQVFAPFFEDLVRLQEELSGEELGQFPPGGEGDFAGTIFGLGAVIGHVLGVYQDFYGGEAFIGTALTEQSLVRHGRRIAYTTDPGVAATGVIAIQVKPGLSGLLPEGLPLLSVPLGEQGSENYETLEARALNSDWNALELTDRTVPIPSTAVGTTELEIQGIGFELVPGDIVLLVRVEEEPTTVPFLRTLVEVREDVTLGITTLVLDEAIALSLPAAGATLADYRVLARPALDLRLFAWDADPQIFPPAEIQNRNDFAHNSSTVIESTITIPGATAALTTTIRTFQPTFGYEVFHEGTSTTYSPDDVYLNEELDDELVGTWAVRLQEGSTPRLVPFSITSQGIVSVSFKREQKQTTQVGTGTPGEQFSTQWVSASTTRVRLDSGDSAVPSNRSAHDVRSHWLAGFELSLELRQEKPNPELVSDQQALSVVGEHPALEPGMLAVFATRNELVAELVELTKIVIVADDPAVPAHTEINWKPRGAGRERNEFQKSNVVLLANVVRVSHGKSKEEVLGDSDGVTPFLRFSLKKSPVTHLPEALGAVPELEIRIAEVLWTSVVDFSGSGPEDRHYVIQRDETGVTSVLFGDGRKGAVPSAGRRHIRAVYRVGLGRIGNVGPGRLSRVEKAHPLVEFVRNPLSVAGGTEPAAVSQIRLEATRFIRTFDRAVSASDYADLALLFPGIARAQATARPNGGVELVVTDADGNPLEDATAFRAFMDARRDPAVALELVAPDDIEFFLSVNVEHDPAFFSFQVEDAVRKALSAVSEESPGLFTFRGRALGEPAFLSQAYRAVNSVPGVVFSEIIHFSLDPEAEVSAGETGFKRISILSDAIRVEPHEWLSLPPGNLRVVAAIREED